MSELIYSENDIPFEELERFGLNRQMIGDLPQHIQTSILRGERSPVLPLRIPLGKKQIKAYSRFRLVPRQNIQLSSSVVPLENTSRNPAQGVEMLGVLFLPRLTHIQDELFTQSQIDNLHEGKTVKVTLPDPIVPASDEPQEFYCQLASGSHQLLTVPAEHLEHNLKVMAQRFQLNSAERQALISGIPVTVYTSGAPMSFGIDLHDPNAIRLCNGDSKRWKYEFDRNIALTPAPEKEYHFATNGCWIESQDGTFEYVDEDDYDQTILEQLQLKRDRNLREVASQGSFFRGR